MPLSQTVCLQSIWFLYLPLGSIGPILTMSKFFWGKRFALKPKDQGVQISRLHGACCMYIQRAFQGTESFVAIKYSKFSFMFIFDNLMVSQNSWMKLQMDDISKAVIFMTRKLVLLSRWMLALCLSQVYPQFFKFQHKKIVVTR